MEWRRRDPYILRKYRGDLEQNRTRDSNLDGHNESMTKYHPLEATQKILPRLDEVEGRTGVPHSSIPLEERELF